MRAAGPGVHLETKGGAFLESIRQYLKRTDKLYLLLCIFSSTMAVSYTHLTLPTILRV